MNAIKETLEKITPASCLSHTLLNPEKAPDALVQKCRDTLKRRGWLPEIAGENFEKGARAWATALQNRLGLVVCGPNGSGKTAFAECVTDSFRRLGTLRTFRLKDPERAAIINYANYGEFLHETIRQYHILLDDVGYEHNLKSYGVDVPGIEAFIIDWIENHGRNCMMVITTNLDGTTQNGEVQSLTNRYSARLDCMKEAFVPVVFVGNTVRKWIFPA